MNAETEKIVSRLEKLGFKVNKECFDGEVYMSRRRRGTTLLADVQLNGNINGEPAEKFIEWARSYK
jgi:hypothetical protein